MDQKAKEKFKALNSLLLASESEQRSGKISPALVLKIAKSYRIIAKQINTKTSFIMREYCLRVYNQLRYLSFSPTQISSNILFDFFCIKESIVEMQTSLGIVKNDELINFLLTDEAEKNTVTKSLILFSLNNIPTKLLKLAMVNTSSQFQFSLVIGFMSEKIIYTNLGNQNYQYVTEVFERFKNYGIKNSLEYSILVKIYLFCSYRSSKKSEYIKATINKIIRRYILKLYPIQEREKSGVLNSTIEKLIIFHERYKENHSMARSFGALCKVLDKNYNVTSICIDRYSDRTFEADFKNSYTVPDTDIRESLDLIGQLKPDCIIYPSIGMSNVGVALSNLRLAPLQVMMHGHPSASYSDMIDVALVKSYSKKHHDKLPEKVIGPSDLSFIATRIEANISVFKRPKRDKSAGNLIIGINCKSFKLSYDFLNFLDRLQSSHDNIKYHFFPNDKNISYEYIRHILCQRYTDCIVHPTVPYEEFLDNLSTIDLALIPFPFGNSGSVVDCLKLSIPVLGLDSDRLSAVGEFMILNHNGLGKYLYPSIEELEDTVAKFISDTAFQSKVYDDFSNLKEPNTAPDPSDRLVDFWVKELTYV